jgi:hypothetical protein
MHIKVATPEYTREEIENEIRKEIVRSLEIEKATESERVNLAQAQASMIKGHKSIPGLGKCVGVMPAREYFRLIKKYGYPAVHSREFLSYFNKKMPELSPNKA